jgi:hypothetical protein
VPWLTIVTLTPGTTATLGSVIVPKTVASWVCGDAHTENQAHARTSGMHDLYEAGTPLFISVDLLFTTIESRSGQPPDGRS